MSGFMIDRLGVVMTLTINSLIYLIAAGIFYLQVQPIQISLKRLINKL